MTNRTRHPNALWEAVHKPQRLLTSDECRELYQRPLIDSRGLLSRLRWLLKRRREWADELNTTGLNFMDCAITMAVYDLRSVGAGEQASEIVRGV